MQSLATRISQEQAAAVFPSQKYNPLWEESNDAFIATSRAYEAAASWSDIKTALVQEGRL